MFSQPLDEICNVPSADVFGGSPNWSILHKELVRPNVTAKLLWLHCRKNTEYTDSYQKFCRSYKKWLSGLSSFNRCQYTAGQKLFVTYIDIEDSYIVDETTGEARPTCLFLAVLGASRYCYAELSLSKNICSWISSHIHALEFFQGSSKNLVPLLAESDYHLCRHARYRELARRCFITIQEASTSKHCPFFNSSKRQIAINLLSRWLAKKLRHHYFVGIAETNSLVQALIQWFNLRPFRQLPGSPLNWFEAIERGCLIALPSMASDQEFWLEQSVVGDHIKIDSHYYSVPSNLIGQPIDVKVTPEFVEVFFQGKQITTHVRQRSLPGRSSTKVEHQLVLDNSERNWSVERVLQWANKIGPATTYLTSTILSHAKNSPAGLRSCLGLLSLDTEYGKERLESACRQAASRKSWTVSIVRSILKQGLDQIFVQLPIPNLDFSKTSARKKKSN